MYDLGDLRVGVGEAVAPAAGDDLGEVALGRDARVEQGPRLEAGHRHRVQAQGRLHVGVGLRILRIMYAIRSYYALRLADGPDEVHWFVVGRAEIA